MEYILFLLYPFCKGVKANFLHNKKVDFADSIFSGRLSCYSGNIASDISYIIIKKNRRERNAFLSLRFFSGFF